MGDFIPMVAIVSMFLGLPTIIVGWSLGKRFLGIVERRTEIQQQELEVAERRLILEERERELEIYKLELEIRQLERGESADASEKAQQQLK
ncbi:MAG: hypothetical protein H9535_11285 [Ignavibacteria bacterium]|nr:hypothetical protein [Ignavibacteria bacterium]